MTKYIFGYGSLLSSASRFQTLQEEVKAIPLTLFGYKRSWNTRASQLGGGITFLGLEPVENSFCNGIVFPVDEEQFVRLAKREAGYQQVELPIEAFQWADPSNSLDIKTVTTFCFVSENRPDNEHPIVQSYLDLCLEGCIELENDFDCIKEGQATEDFIKLTDGWSRYWINDRIHARRPWVHTPLAGQIDRAIRQHLPDLLEHIQIRP